jgi:hypothetical protein
VDREGFGIGHGFIVEEVELTNEFLGIGHGACSGSVLATLIVGDSVQGGLEGVEGLEVDCGWRCSSGCR